MGKKNFDKGLDGLLSGSGKPAVKPRGRPKTNFKIPEKTSEAGTKEHETRATFIVDKDQLEKLKALAHWERSTIKDVLNAALEKYLDGKRDLKEAISTYSKKFKAKAG
jgi:NRPS condensation-like uncharacterized protein